ncbi:MAG TPA: hypothetical protein VMN82_07100 [Thermoanaerobaculia bacterium]|nr:hypothetical protein [Thermoanaerobaculia bacterium]
MRSPVLRGSGAGLAALLLAATVSGGDAAKPATASGTFEDRRWRLEIAGAYAYRGDEDGGATLHVAVSNAELVAEALDDHYDRGHAIAALVADDEVKVVTFDFDAKGRYEGLSYYFESGVGCGFCYDSTVRSTVKAAAGRLSGTVADAGDGRRFEITFDVPIPPKTWGDPLPADGGAPGKAYLAYAAALEHADKAAVRELLDARSKGRWDGHVQDGDLDAHVEYLWHDVHTLMKTIRITGGFVRGDRAVVLFDGSSVFIDHLHGEALLRREDGRWLVRTEMIDVGAR